MYCPFKMVSGAKDLDCAKERCEWYIEEKKKCAMHEISANLDKLYQEAKESGMV